MNYSKLVSRLRQRAFDYDGAKEVQFSRILKEAIARKVEQYEQTSDYKTRYATRQERLLFVTR
jgi:hypothetical protein